MRREGGHGAPVCSPLARDHGESLYSVGSLASEGTFPLTFLESGARPDLTAAGLRWTWAVGLDGARSLQLPSGHPAPPCPVLTCPRLVVSIGSQKNAVHRRCQRVRFVWRH